VDTHTHTHTHTANRGHTHSEQWALAAIHYGAQGEIWGTGAMLKGTSVIKHKHFNK